MRLVLGAVPALSLIVTGLALGQQIAPPPPPPPPLSACGVQGEIEVICGTFGPEDLEPTPDGRYLIVSQFSNPRPNLNLADTGLRLFDRAKQTFASIRIDREPRSGWGEPACPGPLDQMVTHGISLTRRTGGAWQLFAVNHTGRQSVEMYELKRSKGGWRLIWRGCVPTMWQFNDVAGLPDGGFVGSHDMAMRTAENKLDVLSGAPTGWVARWSPGKGEKELPNTRLPFPNGVLTSRDGRFMYVNAWTGHEVFKYDIKTGQQLSSVKVDFMPDNITWTENGKIIAAGIKAVRGECQPGGVRCLQTFGIAEIDPATMRARSVFDSMGKGPLTSGASVGLRIGRALYVGAYDGDRLLKLPWKE